MTSAFGIGHRMKYECKKPIYRLAVQLTERIVVYELYQQSANSTQTANMHYRYKDRVSSDRRILMFIFLYYFQGQREDQSED